MLQPEKLEPTLDLMFFAYYRHKHEKIYLFTACPTILFTYNHIYIKPGAQLISIFSIWG